MFDVRCMMGMHFVETKTVNVLKDLVFKVDFCRRCKKELAYYCISTKDVRIIPETKVYSCGDCLYARNDNSVGDFCSNTDVGGRRVIVDKKIIPEWCPLEKQ